jgi:hypothetical protein
MKLIIFLLPFLLFTGSCSDNSKRADKNVNPEKFDKNKWSLQGGDDYPYRGQMLDDLVYNVKLKGLKKAELINLLGEPDRSDSSYLFYKVSQKRIGFFPLQTRTLVIKLKSDSTVEWRKIHG